VIASFSLKLPPENHRRISQGRAEVNQEKDPQMKVVSSIQTWIKKASLNHGGSQFAVEASEMTGYNPIPRRL
jgi:hypothetical protein